MSIKMVMFDLDGTLLPMDTEKFTRAYFKELAKKAAPYGFEPEKLVKVIWLCTGAMIKNDGSVKNDIVFWKNFIKLCGEKSINNKSVFDEFYEVEFDNVKESCGYNPKAFEIIKYIKSKGIRLGLATNPIFPSIATEKRAFWAGCDVSNFEFYTTYENIGYCKPNLDYYRELLKISNLKPEEVLMVGNDVSEDMVVEKLGMKVFLVTDCLLNKENADISIYPNGNFDDLKNYIDEIIE